MKALVAITLFMALFFGAGPMVHAKTKHVKVTRTQKSKTKKKTKKRKQRGMASWYGANHQGKRTASGERFNMNGFTAAHRTLPLGTVVRVKSLTTGRTVIVRVNDRGPFAKGRIIDVSKAAASKLGMLKRGTDRVEVSILSVPRKPASK